MAAEEASGQGQGGGRGWAGLDGGGRGRAATLRTEVRRSAALPARPYSRPGSSTRGPASATSYTPFPSPPYRSSQSETPFTALNVNLYIIMYMKFLIN